MLSTGILLASDAYIWIGVILGEDAFVSSTWNTTWEAHPDLFLAQKWQECPPEKKKAWHLPNKFAFFQGGETPLRVGIVASSSIPREEEFLLAGMLWGNRLSNGAKTVIYFVAPDFSPFFLHALGKVGGTLSVRAVYFRERLSPSLYLIPENQYGKGVSAEPLGELRPDFQRWGMGLNPVARGQLEVVCEFFDSLAGRGVRTYVKSQAVSILWGNLEIAEITRRGKKFELLTKTKWAKSAQEAQAFQKAGWVDASGKLNPEFCQVVEKIIHYLDELKEKGELRLKDLLSARLYQSEGIISTLWGRPWEWPWQATDRNQSWVGVLSQWFYFQGEGQLSVVCPILEKPLPEGSLSFLLACVLERSRLLVGVKSQGETIEWDGRIHWLTLPSLEEELRRWHFWLKAPEQFPIWTLPESWRREKLEHLSGSFG